VAVTKDIGDLATEYLALQAAIDAQPQTTDPVSGQSHSSGRLVGGLLLYGMRTARLYLEDPLPFWLVGAGLALIGLLILIFAVRGAMRGQ
jgi:hypothetical protein